MRDKCPTCGKLTDYHGESCDPDDIRRHKTNLRNRARSKERRDGLKAAMDSIGVKKVRGNLGGTFWE